MAPAENSNMTAMGTNCNVRKDIINEKFNTFPSLTENQTNCGTYNVSPGNMSHTTFTPTLNDEPNQKSRPRFDSK